MGFSQLYNEDIIDEYEQGELIQEKLKRHNNRVKHLSRYAQLSPVISHS